jgi:hypothetical protein
MRSSGRRLAAALACTLALAACGSEPSDDATSRMDRADGTSAQGTPPPEPATGIPDDFPLSSGMGGATDAIPTSRSGTGLRSLELCGTSPLRGLGTRDRMVADNSGGEALDTRELVLLGSPDAASLVAQAFSDLPNECDLRSTSDGMETTTEVRESTFGAAPAADLVQGYVFDGEPGPGHLIVHVVPVGAALLVTQTYGEWPDVSEGIARTADAVAEVVDAMAVFADPETTTTAPGTAPPQASTEIPDDFPLAAGLPQDDGETEVSPPSQDGDGMGEVDMCGTVVWPVLDTPGGTTRLLASASGPEWFDGRELVVHATPTLAARAMEAMRVAAATCRSADHQVWTALEPDTGLDTVTMGLTYDNGLGSSVFQVTRVGSARLMVSTYGEGSLASLEEQAHAVTGTTEKIVPAMCVFTKTGC